MIYCDTSLLVSLLALEASTPQVQLWMAGQPAGSICVSGWVVAEVSSALSTKCRYGALTSIQHIGALAQWRALLAENLALIAVPTEAWDLSASFCDRRELNLRAGDALHIAIASLNGHSLATLDRTMADAARALGVGVEDIPGA